MDQSTEDRESSRKSAAPPLSRPPSEQLVDLHVYIVPEERWLRKRKLARNHVVDYAISAGFIRVLPTARLVDVRQEIDRQLGHDVVPKEYVFLRSVGRNFTQVKDFQEMDLKAKSFLPPCASEPEIYLKSGQFADHSWSHGDESGLDEAYLDARRTHEIIERRIGALSPPLSSPEGFLPHVESTRLLLTRPSRGRRSGGASNGAVANGAAATTTYHWSTSNGGVGGGTQGSGGGPYQQHRVTTTTTTTTHRSTTTVEETSVKDSVHLLRLPAPRDERDRVEREGKPESERQELRALDGRTEDRVHEEHTVGEADGPELSDAAPPASVRRRPSVASSASGVTGGSDAKDLAQGDDSKDQRAGSDLDVSPSQQEQQREASGAAEAPAPSPAGSVRDRSRSDGAGTITLALPLPSSGPARGVGSQRRPSLTEARRRSVAAVPVPEGSRLSVPLQQRKLSFAGAPVGGPRRGDEDSGGQRLKSQAQSEEAVSQDIEGESERPRRRPSREADSRRSSTAAPVERGGDTAAGKEADAEEKQEADAEGAREDRGSSSAEEASSEREARAEAGQASSSGGEGGEVAESALDTESKGARGEEEKENEQREKEAEVGDRDGRWEVREPEEGDPRYFREEGPYRLEVTEEEENEPVAQSQTTVAPAVGKVGDVAAAAAPNQRTSWRTTGGGDRAYRRSKYPSVEPQLHQKQHQRPKELKTRAPGVTRGGGSKQVAAGAKTPVVTTMSDESKIGATQKQRQGRRSRGQSGVTVQVAKVRLIPGRPAAEAGTAEANAEESEIREYVHRGDKMRDQNRDAASRKASTRHMATNIDTARTVVESYRKSDAAATAAAKKPKRERTFDVEVYVTEMGDTGTQTGSATDASGKAIKERGSSSKGGGGGSGQRRRSRSHKSLSKSETHGSLHGDKDNARTTGGENTTDADGSSLADTASSLLDNGPHNYKKQLLDDVGNFAPEQSRVESENIANGEDHVAENGLDEGASADDEGSGDESTARRDSVPHESGSVGLENGVDSNLIHPELAVLQSSQSSQSPERLDTNQNDDLDEVENERAEQTLSDQFDDATSVSGSSEVKEKKLSTKTGIQDKPPSRLENAEPAESEGPAEEDANSTAENATPGKTHAGQSSNGRDGNGAQCDDISANDVSEDKTVETKESNSEDLLDKDRKSVVPDEAQLTVAQQESNESPGNNDTAAKQEDETNEHADSKHVKPEDVEMSSENNVENSREARELEPGEYNADQNYIPDALEHTETNTDKNSEQAGKGGEGGITELLNNDPKKPLTARRKANEVPETQEESTENEDSNDLLDKDGHVTPSADVNNEEVETTFGETGEAIDKFEERPLREIGNTKNGNLGSRESAVEDSSGEASNAVENIAVKKGNETGTDLSVEEGGGGPAEMDTKRSVSAVGTRPGTAVLGEALESKDAERDSEDLAHEAVEKVDESAVTAEENSDDNRDVDGSPEKGTTNASSEEVEERSVDLASQEDAAVENGLGPTSVADITKSSKTTDEESDNAHAGSMEDKEGSRTRMETDTTTDEDAGENVGSNDHANSVQLAENEPERNSSPADKEVEQEIGQDILGKKDFKPFTVPHDLADHEVVDVEESAGENVFANKEDIEQGVGTNSDEVEGDQISSEEANVTGTTAEDTVPEKDTDKQGQEKGDEESAQGPEVAKRDDVIQYSDNNNENPEDNSTGEQRNDGQGENGNALDEVGYTDGDRVVNAEGDHDAKVKDAEPFPAVTQQSSDIQETAKNEPIVNHGGEDPISSDSAPGVETAEDNAESILAASEGDCNEEGQGDEHLDDASDNAQETTHSAYDPAPKERYEGEDNEASKEIKEATEPESDSADLGEEKVEEDRMPETSDNFLANAEKQEATITENSSDNVEHDKDTEADVVSENSIKASDSKEATEVEISLPAVGADRASPTTDLDTSRAEEDSAFADGTCTSTPSPATSRAEMSSPKDPREGENLDEGILVDEAPLNKDSPQGQEEDGDGAVDATSSSSGRGSRGTVTEVPIPAVHKPQIRGIKAPRDATAAKPPRIKAPRGVNVLPAKFKPAAKRNAKEHSVAGTGGIRRVRSDGEKMDQASRTALTTPEQRLDKGAARLLGRHSRSVNMEEQGVVEIARLQKKLDALREERLACEAKREDLLRRAKFLQSKATSTRDQARDMWRRRYAEEKKITPKLEEESARWRLELERLHRELLARVEGELRLTGYPRFEQPSNKLSYKIMIAKVLQEIEDLKRRLEYTRISLGAEVRLRTHAEREVKNLREDLLKKKIQVTLTKKETQSVMAPFLRDSFYFVGPI